MKSPRDAERAVLADPVGCGVEGVAAPGGFPAP